MVPPQAPGSVPSSLAAAGERARVRGRCAGARGRPSTLGRGRGLGLVHGPPRPTGADAEAGAPRYTSRMPIVHLNGTDLHYRDAGDQTANAVVLLHAFPLHSGMWQRQIAVLEGRHRVVAL